MSKLTEDLLERLSFIEEEAMQLVQICRRAKQKLGRSRKPKAPTSSSLTPQEIHDLKMKLKRKWHRKD